MMLLAMLYATLLVVIAIAGITTGSGASLGVALVAFVGASVIVFASVFAHLDDDDNESSASRSNSGR
jgi:hypothetical protein